MIVETKVRLLSSSKFQISSSKEAFLASKITESWQSRDDIFKAVSGVFSRKEFDLSVQKFIDLGAIEENVNKKKKIIVNNGIDFRDYIQVCFNESELNEAPEIPDNIKKEILFLYYYGRSLDYYRMLNLEKSPKVTAERVMEKCRYYRSLFAGRNFDSINMYGYRKKLERVRKLINGACKITDPEEKERYDAMLFSISAKTRDDVAQNEIQSSSQIADKHFVLAMKFSSQKQFKQAYGEVQLALQMEPENGEYIKFKRELKELLNEERSKQLFDTLENNEFILLDEEKLTTLIDDILELNDGSAQSHLKLAKIAIEKGMPEMALEHSYHAVKLDPDLKAEVAGIVSFAKRKIQELGKMADGTKTFEINKNDILRKK